METSNLKRQRVIRMWQALVFGFLLLPWIGFSQPSLDFFTNRANVLLQSQFGFGVTNIPVYSATNPAVAYSAAIHFALQSAANAYDQTTPDTDFPSVFRPQFSMQSNALFIIGYTNVTTDFDAQMDLGFKNIEDPTIGLDDNVWGIPWVVGAKGYAPAFNEYSYATAFAITRKLVFTRLATNLPPRYTNQFYIMTFSNLFAAEAWNFKSANFFTNATIFVSNQVTILFTNNYNWGTNFIVNNSTNWPVDSWLGSPNGSSRSFKVPLLANSIPLPGALWSEAEAQLLALTNVSTYPASDLQQTGWPQHNWTLSISNNLLYALLDTSTGTNRVLDFVNLSGLSSSINVTQALTHVNGVIPVPPNSLTIAWDPSGATDSPNSPMSIGMSNQIQISLGTFNLPDVTIPPIESTAFRSFLLGLDSDPILSVVAPYDPTAIIYESCTWQAVNPLVHYTLGDLTHPTNTFTVVTPSIFSGQFFNSIGSIGKINPAYLPAKTNLSQPSLNNGAAQFNFSGYTNLPYGVWGSTNLSDWVPLGTVSQTSPGSFQFTDPTRPDSRSRFYRLQVP